MKLLKTKLNNLESFIVRHKVLTTVDKIDVLKKVNELIELVELIEDEYKQSKEDE